MIQKSFTIILQSLRIHLQLYYNQPEFIYNYITITQNSFTIILQSPRIHLQLYYNYLGIIYNYITIAQNSFTILYIINDVDRVNLVSDWLRVIDNLASDWLRE
jgi:hypothetical protein